MNVWLIQISEALPVEVNARKLRTSMLADALVEHGHNVTWWASAFNHLKKEWYFNKDTDIKISERYSIKAMHGIGYKSNLSLARLIDHRLLAWKFKLSSARQEKPDLIVCSMPSYDLAWRAMKYSVSNQIPLIIDIRDQWPDNFLDFVPIKLRRIFGFVLGREFRMLNQALIGANGLVSMSDALLEWALLKANRPRAAMDKIIYLGYKEHDSTKGQKIEKFQFLEDKFANYFVVTFIGTFGKYHDPRILIDCAKRTGGLKIIYVLGGDGEFNDELRESARLLENVFFVGWLNQNEATRLLELSNLGVCSTGNYTNKNFFPNKVYSYWAAGLPTASAFQGELYEIIKQYRVGFNYTNLDEFVSGIHRFYYDPAGYSEARKNAKKLFHENYNYSKIYNEFVSHLENIVDGHNK